MTVSPRTWMTVAVIVLILAVAVDEWERVAPAPERTVPDETLERVLARNLAASRERSTAAHELESADNPVASTAGAPPADRFQRFRRASVAPPEPRPAAPAHPWLAKERGIEDVVAATDARGWGFAWIQFDTSFDSDRLRTEWRAHGVDVLGFSGEYARVRVPASRSLIEALASHSAVRGMGIRPPEDKMAADLASADGAANREIPVLITLIEEDPNGTWRTELEALGVVVGEWWSEWRAYSANVWSDSLETVAARDFVVDIEPVRIVNALLDTAVPAMGADHARDYDPSSGEFSGTVGSTVPVGIADTGLNTNHRDISTDRTSICGESFQPDDPAAQGRDLWMDFSGHGTHVTGIVAGRGVDEAQFGGIAPGVRDIRMAKVLDRRGSGDALGVAGGVRYLARATSCVWQDDEPEAARPLVVNFSLGSRSRPDGRSASSRNIDAVVWEESQLYALAAGNSGSSGVSGQSSAKNVVSIGAVTDAGVVNSFSSHGPTADGRLNPHIVGTGSAVQSARGNARRDGYWRASGTSMAAPSVAGVAALLMDRDEVFRERPAYAKARLMASAVKPAAILGSADFPTDNTQGPGAFNHEYGLGLASAGTALGDGPDGAWWHGGDHGTVAAGEVYEYELEVPVDTARLDVVLTWIEPPIERISPTTVAADLDLYLDRDGDCEEAACGEHASTSRVDNVEWVVVPSPPAGTYTLRIVAANGFADPVRTGIAWTAVATTDTPALTLNAQSTRVDTDVGDHFEINLTVGVDGYVSAGTTLHLLCAGSLSCDRYRVKRWRADSAVARTDGTKAAVDQRMTSAIPLGEIRSGEAREVVLVVPPNVAMSSHVLYFQASSWNATAASLAVEVVVDGEENAAPAERPANDAMSTPTALEGESGELPFDLLRASRDPGEPMVRADRTGSGIKKFFWESRSAGDGYDGEMQIYARHSSLWYVIDAERTGPYRLSAKAAERNAPPIGITVYSGWASDTTRIVTGTDKVEFIAHAGGNFLVQVWSHEPWRIPARLVWDQHPHSPPENDDFADSQVLAGSSGSVKGTNYRATLEAFEFYGLRVDGATTWFTWTAPEAGWYQWRLLLNERPLRIAPDLHTLVFSGTDTHSLRRVSSIPSRGDNTHIPAELGKEYHIAVLDDGKRLISDYELRWSSRAQPLYTHFSNDMFDDAETIESTSGIRRLSIHKFRTVEPGEPELSGTGTAWWRWVAPADGRQVFRLDKARHEKLTLFTGTSVEDLEPVDDGAAVVADALQGESYSLSLGFRETSKFADLEYVTYEYATELHWGPVPKNDRPDEAEVLAGVSGSASGNHTYATTSDDEPNDIQGHSSLWWSWHASSTGWQRFELEGWNAEDIQGYVHPREPTRQQSILAVYRRTDSDDLELLATSDHSYVASGRMEATIRAREGENYLVRVALRATNLNPGWSRETAFTYATVPAPKWKRILPRVVEANPQPGDVEDDGLDRPRSLAVVGDPERVVVATRDNLAVYEDQPDGTVLTRTDTIPYTLEDGESVAVLDHAILHWNQPASELYLVQHNDLWVVRGLDGGSKHLERCTIDRADCPYNPTDVDTDSDGNLYIVGSECLEVYERTAPCEFKQSQVVRRRWDLYQARSLAVEPDGQRVFATAFYGVEVYQRGADGLFSRSAPIRPNQIDICAEPWDRSRATVALSDELLFLVGGTSPTVALYRVRDAEGNQVLEKLDVLSKYFISLGDVCTLVFGGDPLFSHVPEPSPTRCVSATTDGAAVDLFCDEQVVTVQWDEDARELFVSDWFESAQGDRFGGNLQGGLLNVAPRHIGESADGGRNYVLGQVTVGTLHVFERMRETEADPQSEE